MIDTWERSIKHLSNIYVRVISKRLPELWAVEWIRWLRTGDTPGEKRQQNVFYNVFDDT